MTRRDLAEQADQMAAADDRIGNIQAEAARAQFSNKQRSAPPRSSRSKWSRLKRRSKSYEHGDLLKSPPLRRKRDDIQRS